MLLSLRNIVDELNRRRNIALWCLHHGRFQRSTNEWHAGQTLRRRQHLEGNGLARIAVVQDWSLRYQVVNLLGSEWLKAMNSKRVH